MYFRSYTCITELILVLRTTEHFTCTKVPIDTTEHVHYTEVPIGITGLILILVLRILYRAYFGTKVPIGTTQIHYTEVPVGTTELILILQDLYLFY